MPAMIRTAHLRVYVAERMAPRQRRVAGHSRPWLVESGFGLLAESMREGALVTDWHERRYVCPRFPRLRALEGLLAFHHAYAEIGGDLIVPEQVAKRAADELDALYQEPATRSYILTSPWHVPLRWFVAFDPSEREVLTVPEGTSVRYRTSLARATDRVADALDTLRGAGMDDLMTEDLDELRAWLEGFPVPAMVELDYASVAGLFETTDLLFDETASDIHAALDALDHGDWETATNRYSEAARRWAPLAAVTLSN
jgi:hypothetical protein